MLSNRKGICQCSTTPTFISLVQYLVHVSPIFLLFVLMVSSHSRCSDSVAYKVTQSEGFWVAVSPTGEHLEFVKSSQIMPFTEDMKVFPPGVVTFISHG